MIAKAEKERREAEEFKKILHDRYADVVPDLAVGQPAPEVVSEDVEGKNTRLSALKGKVVVLDVWATWCGPCKAMIPNEREMVARLKDKPFQLVSISVDEEKKTLIDFLTKEPMPWPQWWNGADGKMIDTLGVVNYPTIFVIDAQGVIAPQAGRQCRGVRADRGSAPQADGVEQDRRELKSATSNPASEAVAL